MLARDDIAVAGHCVRTRAQERRRDLAAAAIGGLILDYDVTIITDDERYGVPRSDIASELVRLDAHGVLLGSATGRAGSVVKALREVFTPERTPGIIVGSYNWPYTFP